MLERRPEEPLRYSRADAAGPGWFAPTVTLALHPEGHGTRLFLEHRGFDSDDPIHQMSRTIMSGGWRTHVVRRLMEFLADARDQMRPASSR